MHARFVSRALRLGLSIALLMALPVVADPPSGRRDHVGWTDGQGVGARAKSSGETAGSKGRHAASGRRPICKYVPLSAEDAAVADFLATHDQSTVKPVGPGTWYAKMCVDDQGHSAGTVEWFQRPPRTPTAPHALAQEVLRYMPLPLPGIGMNPPPERDQLVHLPVWLWVDGSGWNPVSTSASAGGVTVTVEAEPERVIWDMGNGDVVVCGPGTPYDPARPPTAQSTGCSYTYRNSSASQPGQRYRVSATAEWRATWTVAGAPGGGDLGIVRRSTSTFVRVAEAQAVNTAPSS
jgi:hypothetical protein